MSVWGKPLLIANQNLAAPLILGGKLNDTTGAYEDNAGTGHMATRNFMPVDFAKHLVFYAAWDTAAITSSARFIAWAYNANYEAMGRITGGTTNPRRLLENAFNKSQTSASGPIAYIRVRFYNVTFSQAMIESAKLRVYMLDADTTNILPYYPRGIRFIS